MIAPLNGPPSTNDLAATLRLVADGHLPVPHRLASAATYAVVNGLIDLEIQSLSDKGQRMLTILGGLEDR